MMEGNYRIENTLDVDLLQPYTEITGSLIIDSSELTSLALPNLDTPANKSR